MPTSDIELESLTQVIESLQDNIKRNGQIIGWNETRTRQALIDPVLRALGWMDPSVVTLEYTVTFRRPPLRNFRVDYALHQPDARGALIAFVEAKRMHTVLDKEHRVQVFEYAMTRSVECFILTNGDQWEMYEITKDDVHVLFEFSIRRQSASDCADLLLSHFPKSPITIVADQAMPERLPQAPQHKIQITSRPSEVPAPVPHVRSHNLKDIFRPSKIHVLPTDKLNDGVDVPKGLVWLGITLAIFGIIGWISGVWNTEPMENFLQYIGLFSLLMILMVAAYVMRRLFRTLLLMSFEVLQLWRLFTPIKGNKPKTLVWIAISMLVGISGGLVGGYFIGIQTAEFVINALQILGIVVISVTIAALVFLLIIEAIKQDQQKRYRRRR